MNMMSWMQVCVLCAVALCALASPWGAGKRSAKYMRILEDAGRFDPMHDECGLEEDEREECGKRTYEEGTCKSRGCCFRECEGCAKEIPWCYLAKRMLREECAVDYEDKDDCGYYGIQEGECFMRDCCWKPSALTNDPPCFKKKSSNNLRLVNGEETETLISGRLEIKHNEVWGTVCDDNFDLSAAKVICRSLGFEFYHPVGHAYFGEGIDQIWLDGMRCGGSETTIEECSHNGWGEHDCGHSEDAGVVCSHEEIPADYFPHAYPDEYYNYGVDPYVYEPYEPYEYSEDEYNGGVSNVTDSDVTQPDTDNNYNWYRNSGKAKGRGRNGFKGKPAKRQVLKASQRSAKVNAILRQMRSRQMKRSQHKTWA